MVKFLKVLNQTAWKYTINIIVAFLLIVISILFFANLEIDKQSKVKLESVEHQVSLVSEYEIPENNCDVIQQTGFVCGVQITRLRQVSTYRLDIKFPQQLLRNKTGEIRVSVRSAEIQLPENTTISDLNIAIQLSIHSEHFIFTPEKVFEIPFEKGHTAIVHFDAKTANSDGGRKILFRSEIKDDSSTKTNKLMNTSLDVEVLPPTILLGLSENTLKGLETVFTGLGIPALLLFIVTFTANHRKEKKELSKEESRIIIPGASANKVDTQ